MRTARAGSARTSIDVPKRFRPEIEGVRVVAALLVASYHIWSGRVSGGVDVFFVMSGFLITTTLLRQLGTFGRIRPLTYLSRLALRLLPAALTVLAAVLIATRLLLPALFWTDIGREVRVSALYFENWFLAATSTDYLAQWDDKTPVQHFWAMSLQGQFYVAWLCVFLVLALLVRRWPQRAVALVAGALSLIFATSLAYSIWYTAVDQPVAYFSTPARAWEFALGGLAAIALRRQPSRRSPLRWTLGWVGLAVLLTTGLMLQVSSVFPGYAALLPTGAALLILLAADSGIPAGADALLARRPLVWLGSLSYGIYLWHFPLLIFYRNLRDTGTNSIRSGVAIILASVLLAWLTQQLVERPLSNFMSRAPRTRRIGLGGLLSGATAVVVAASLLGTGLVSQDKLEEFQGLADTLNRDAYSLGPCTGAQAGPPTASADCARQKGGLIGPPPELIEETQDALPCRVETKTAVLTVCIGGSTAKTARATAMLIGDSHSLTMRPALDRVAQENNWRLLFAYGPGCQTAVRPKTGTTTERCRKWMTELTHYIQERRGGIDVLFTMQAAGRTLEGVPKDTRTDSSMSAYRKQWDRFEGHIKQLVVIRDTPQMSSTVISCVARHLNDTGDHACSQPRGRALDDDYAALAAAKDRDPSTGVVDLSDVFCDRARCYPVIGNYIAYRDAVHLHTVFAPTLAPKLDEAINRALSTEMRTRMYCEGSCRTGQRH